ncbi:hypothetical protein AB0M32_25325 [Streptomyces sp. NPDC051985]|uniref:hypothetical protein n=1 Tax=Streptomyces sp. NPDC051985 TaxID=3155807 RepID=UPI00341BFA7D
MVGQFRAGVTASAQSAPQFSLVGLGGAVAPHAVAAGDHRVRRPVSRQADGEGGRGHQGQCPARRGRVAGVGVGEAAARRRERHPADDGRHAPVGAGPHACGPAG